MLTTKHDTSILVHPRQREIQNFSANVVKEHVEVSNMLLEFLVERLALVVQCLLHAQLLLEPIALLSRASDGVNLRAFLLTNLADDRASCTCCAGDEKGLPWLQFTNV